LSSPAAPRAAIIASGSELVRGDRQDRNGPYLAGALLDLGIEPAQIRLVGDGEADLEQAIREGMAFDLLCISGGLGPTHDDRTIELLARAAGVELVVDDRLVDHIGAMSRRIAERLKRPYADFEPGVIKQASLPAGSVAVDPVGTAPAVVLDTGACVAVSLPGPPRELQALWPQVLGTEPLRRLLARARTPTRRVAHLYGASESLVAQALAEAGGEVEGIDVTICAHDFEIHVDLFVQPGAEARADAIERAFLGPLEAYVFTREAVATPALVLQLLRQRGLTLATAESCTGGLVAARLTDVPGSSDTFLGGVVAYSNDVKRGELDVPAEVIAAHGAVSAETAAAMAEGARRRLGTDVSVAVTGVAGPDGGTPEKPVGLVYLHAAGPGGERTLRLDLPGDRETVRLRATTAALHLVRRLVTES
jgi:nicotinamide-nucleotide amidase